MKRILALSAACTLLAGCNTTSFSTTDASGRTTTINNTRLAWNTQGYLWQFSTNGTWSASASSSNPDAATVQAFTQLIQAALAGAAVAQKAP
jgi:hypothetical protein